MSEARRFAVFDIDGTVIRWQMFHAIVDELAKRQLIPPESFERINASRMEWKNRKHEESFKQYESELVQSFLSALQGLKVSDYTAACHTIFEKYKDQAYRYTRRLIRELKEENYVLFAVSGSPVEVVELFAEYYGFTDFAAAVHEQQDGFYTGKTRTTIFNKDELLKQLAAKHNASFTGSIGVGDSEGDIAMLELVERPIAFNPSKKLFDHAKSKGWKVAVERKNVAYELTRQQDTYCLDQG